ncbi:MAG: nucleotide exchange factor GrpE [Haloferacaceae archaeon]
MSDDAAECDASDANSAATAGVGTASDDEELTDAEGDDGTVADARNGSTAAADLADRVADHDEALADEVRNLQADLASKEDRVAELEERVEELEAKLKRKAADFENYKKRAERRREELKERAAEDLVERVVEVRDDLVRALDQKGDAGLRDGIESTLDTFDRVLEEENVEPIEPAPGDEVDPHRHEVMMRVESDRPEGRIVDLYRPGYEMAGHVVQTAQVTVSDGSAGDGGE